jgi:hypothetical protein
VIVSGLGLPKLRCGDVVVFDHPEYGRLIKRVEQIEPCGHLHVRGDDIDSIDSRRFGPIPRSFVRARMIAHIKR